MKGFSIQPHPTYGERSIDQQGVDYVGDTRDPYRGTLVYQGVGREGAHSSLLLIGCEGVPCFKHYQ